jgi:hypothetical protein
MSRTELQGGVEALQVVRDGKSYITYIDLDVRISPNPGHCGAKRLYIQRRRRMLYFWRLRDNSMETDEQTSNVQTTHGGSLLQQTVLIAMLSIGLVLL